jgi:hypothetical protein
MHLPPLLAVGRGKFGESGEGILVLAAGGVPLCVSLSGLCTLLCLLLAAALFLRAAVEHVVMPQ